MRVKLTVAWWASNHEDFKGFFARDRIYHPLVPTHYFLINLVLYKEKVAIIPPTQ